MKFILVVLVVLFGVWVWRRNREEEREERAERRQAEAARKPAASAAAPVEAIEMVRCLHCGVHCPRTDAINGRLGVYCSTQHRVLAEP